MRKQCVRQMQNPFFRYGFAIAMAAVSVGWRHAMTPVIGTGYQYVTVFPLIILVAMLAGRWPALVHATVAGVLSTYFFSDRLNPAAALVTILVIATGVLTGDLAQRLHTALGQARLRSEELAQRESLIRSISRSTDVLIAALNKDFKFIFFNEAYRRGWQQMWNQKIEIGTSLLKVTDPWPSQQRKGKELWNRALKGESFRVTVDFGPSEAEVRLFDIHFNPIYDAQGNQVGAAQIMRDITDLVRTQEAIRESELFYRQTLESIPGMVFTTRPDGYCDYQSRQWVEYTGVPMKEMLGDGWNKLLHPADRAAAYAAWRAAVQELAPYDVEYRVRRYDGLYEWFKVRGRPIRDAAGNIVRWFGVATNIGDIRKTADALKQSETRFRGTFENAAVGITHVDLDGNWIDVNRKFCDMVGYSKEALIGISFLILTLPEDMQDDLRLYDELRTGQRDSYFVEKRYRHKDGHVLWVDLHRALQRDEKGNPLYSIAVVIDITERKRAEEALRQSERRFRAVFEQSAIGMGRVTFEDARWADVNDAFCRMLGYSRDEMLGVPWPHMTHAEDVDLDLMSFKEMAQGKLDSYTVEKRFIHKKGYFTWARLTLSLVRDAEGKPDYEIAVIEDITARKRAEEALRQSEEQFHGMFDRHYAVKLIIDPESGEICDANQAAVKFYGYSRRQLCGMRIQEINQLTEEEIAAERRRAAAEERNYFVFPHRLADGSVRTVEAYSTPVPIGGTIRLYSIIHDVTERRKAEEALRQSERRYRTLFESIDEGFCIIEVVFDAQQKPVDYRLLEFNPAFERQTGLHAAVGQTIRSLTPDLEPHWYEIYGQVALTGQPTRFVNEARALNRWFNVYAFRVGEPHEHKVAVLFNNITQFKRAEQDLLQYRDRLEKKNREMESIIGIVSHDLRAPLVNIQGFSHEIQADCKALDTTLERVAVEENVERQLDRLLHHSIPESLQYVQTSAEAMNRLVVTLVEVARAGMAPTRPERIDMNQLMAEIVANLKIKFKEADVSYSIDVLPACQADRTQLIQIFTNLLDNAVKYLHPRRRGVICVEGAVQAEGVLYSVSDNGIGISQDQQEKIFEPYYQLKEKAAGGIGMGLATVKTLVERNNGRIWVVSEKDSYSIFYILLPVPGPYA